MTQPVVCKRNHRPGEFSCVGRLRDAVGGAGRLIAARRGRAWEGVGSVGVAATARQVPGPRPRVLMADGR